MSTPFWEWRGPADGRYELFKEGRRVLALDAAGTIRGLATPAGTVVGDLGIAGGGGAVRFTSTAYIATLDAPAFRLRVRSGDRITRVDVTALAGGTVPALVPRTAAGFDLPPASAAPYRVVISGGAGLCVMESASARSVCAFDDPASFDPALAFAAFTATAT